MNKYTKQVSEYVLRYVPWGTGAEAKARNRSFFKGKGYPPGRSPSEEVLELAPR